MVIKGFESANKLKYTSEEFVGTLKTHSTAVAFKLRALAAWVRFSAPRDFFRELAEIQ